MNVWSHAGWGCVLALAVGSVLAADGPTDALPSLDAVLQGIVERAGADARIQEEFAARYAFIHAKTREEYNSKCRLKKRHTESVPHDPATHDSTGKSSLSSGGSQRRVHRRQTRSQAESGEEPPDRPYERGDVVVDESLLRRFQFTLVGREVWEAIPLLRLDFRPVVPNRPAKGVLDRFINKMAGTVWVTESDYTYARIRLQLTEKVNVGVGGVLGSVSAFECDLERLKTEDGLWYTRRVEWRAEYREFLVSKIVEQRETRTDVRKVRERVP